MANQDVPFGFRPVKHLSGAEFNEQVNLYSIGASEAALFVGDLVFLTSTSDANGVPGISRAPAGVTDALLGAIVAFPADRDNQGRTNHPASTAGTCYVADSPDIIYEAQVTTIAATDMSNIADIVATAGSTTTGNSAMEINGATFGTGAQVRVLRLKSTSDTTGGENELGANAVVECILLQPQLRTQAVI